MNVPTLLVIDDEPSVLETVRGLGQQAGFDVVACATGGEGIDASRRSRPDLVMVDLRMPDLDGLQVLRAIHQADPRCQMVLMTGFASVETAVEAIKIGAMDYLSKPLDVGRVEQLLRQVRRDVDTAVYTIANREITLRGDGFPEALRLVDAILAARQAA